MRRAVIWFALSALTGGYWYLRNLVAAGNPIPPQRFTLGPLHFPSIPYPGAESLANYVFNERAWRVYFVPGVRAAFGPAWWVFFLALAAGFTIGCVFARGSTVRMLAILAGVSFAAFVLSPQLLQFGSTGRLIFFNANLRYTALALALGGLVLPLAAVPRFGRGAVHLLLVVYAGTIAVTQLYPGVWYGYKTIISHTPHDYIALAVGVTIGAGLFAVGAIRITLRTHARPRDWLSRRLRIAAVTTVVVVASAGGFSVQRHYLAHRYERTLLTPQAETVNALFRWARSTHDTRIAIVGFNAQYPLYGKDSSNFVQYIAKRHADRTSTPIRDCRTWRRAVNQGNYEYVVTTTENFPFPSNRVTSWEHWTRSDPAAQLVFHHSAFGNQAWVYRIVHPMDLAGCPEVRAQGAAR